jgi:hypothetical protein
VEKEGGREGGIGSKTEREIVDGGKKKSEGERE